MKGKRKGQEEDNDSASPSRLSRLDLSGVKRKPGEEEEEGERKVGQRKALRPVESPYDTLRRDLIAAFPATPIVAPTLLNPKKHSFMDHVTILINMKDETGLMKMLDHEKLDPQAVPYVFRTVVRNNLLSVIVKLTRDYPQVDIEAAVQDAIRYPTCTPITMKLVLTLWADEHGETIEEAAKQMLDKVGKDSMMLDSVRLRVLREMAGMPSRGLDEEEPTKPKIQPRQEDEKEIQLEFKGGVIERIRPTYVDEIDAQQGFVPAAVFTPNGKYVLYGARNASFAREKSHIHVFGVEALKVVRYLEDILPVRCLAVASDSKTVYVASYDRIRVFDLDTGNMVRKIDEPRIRYGLRHGIQAIALSPDGKFVAIGDNHGHVFIIDLRTGLAARSLDPPHPETFMLCFSFDSTVLVWTSTTGRSAIWDTQTGQRFAGTLLSEALDVAVSPVEPLLAILSAREPVVALWDFSTRKVVRSFRFPPGIDPVNVAFSPNGTKLVLSGSLYAFIDIATQVVVYVGSFGSGRSDINIAVSPIDYRLVASTNPGFFTFVDFRGGAAVKALREVVSSGLVNSANPQSAWDQFLSRGLYDPRLFYEIFAFNAKMV